MLAFLQNGERRWSLVALLKLCLLYPSYLKRQRCWLHSFTGTPARSNHIAYLCSWGFTHLPPTCNFKLFGYKL
ncbi:hypothetical protein CRN52_09615 [Vibrio vulnificus]|uniref:Uncharacterized protein n=1 Tax=Vibrio vulnificus TaxID=672 RepID=A0A2S3R400_VIBVL|nr:hypothetical protein CRN52_09615 [Vibrio vulnificus]